MSPRFELSPHQCRMPAAKREGERRVCRSCGALRVAILTDPILGSHLTWSSPSWSVSELRAEARTWRHAEGVENLDVKNLDVSHSDAGGRTMSTAPQPGLAPGFLLSGGRVWITIEVRSRRLVIDWFRVEPEDEPQPRGDVFTSTERSYDDEPAELRVGFRGA